MSVFVDTNIWLYALFAPEDPDKQSRARRQLGLAADVVVSHQVIVEVSSVLLRKARLAEPDIRTCIARIYDRCQRAMIVPSRPFLGPVTANPPEWWPAVGESPGMRTEPD